MRAYVITTGLLFAILVLAHIARVFAEGVGHTMDPCFVVATLVAAGLSLWAWRLVRKPHRPVSTSDHG